MYLAIIILPLLGSIASGFFGRKIGVSGAQVITCTAVVLTTLLAVVAFFEVGYNNIPVSIEVFRWIDSESLNVWWGFHFDLVTVSRIIPVILRILLFVGILYILNDYSFKNCKHRAIILLIHAFICYTWGENILNLGNDILKLLPGIFMSFILADIELSLVLLPRFMSYMLTLGLNMWFNKKKIFVWVLIFYCLRIIFIDLSFLFHLVTNAVIENNFFALLSFYFSTSLLSLLFPNLNLVLLINFLALDKLSFVNIFNYIGLSKLVNIISDYSCGICLKDYTKIVIGYIKSFIGVTHLLIEWTNPFSNIKIFYSYLTGCVLFFYDLYYSHNVIHCSSSIEEAKWFRELPFSDVGSKEMVEEFKTKSYIKSKKDLSAEFELFRSIQKLDISGSKLYMPSDHFNANNIEHSEPLTDSQDRGKKRPYNTIQKATNKRPKVVLDTRSSGNNSVENSIDIVPRNNNSITSADFTNDFFNYSTIHGKITNLIKNNQVKYDDHLSKLVFEPKSLKKTFYRNIESLDLSSGKAYHIRLSRLVKVLEDAMRVAPQNRITTSDFTKDLFDYSTIHGKITNLIKNNQVNHTDNFSKLVFEPKSLRIPFYRKVEALGLSNCDKTRSTTFNVFLKTLEKYMDIPAVNINSISKEDFSENTFDSLSIYLKLNNLVEQGEFSKNKGISQLIFEPESLRQPFYRKVEALKLTNVKATASMTLSTLLRGLKVKADMVIYNDIVIEREDFLGENFKFDVVHRKITNLINEGEANKGDYIFRLKFPDDDIRQDFYAKIQDLNIIKNKRVLRVKIGTLLNNLQEFTS